MRKLNSKIWLSLIMIISISFIYITNVFFVSFERNDYYPEMVRAASLAEKWFDLICRKKIEKGIKRLPETGKIKYAELIGEEYNELTTTIGSLEAKKISLNPDFAALMFKWLKNAGIDSSNTVGISCSASFPALIISAIAAVKIIKAEIILISSIGASTYGANDSSATWLDIESWLRQDGGMECRSEMVTYGSDDDRGIGYSEEGLFIINEAAKRNNVKMFIPSGLDEAIKRKEQLFHDKKISMYINIGGNHSALGNCSHSASIPNGFYKKLWTCSDPDRGLIYRISERGIPVINLLNIKNLAVKNGLDTALSGSFEHSEQLYLTKRVNKPVTILFLFIIIGFLILFKKMCKL